MFHYLFTDFPRITEHPSQMEESGAISATGDILRNLWVSKVVTLLIFNSFFKVWGNIFIAVHSDQS